jgi:carbon starvation protein CstA
MNALTLVFISLCLFAIGYRFYGLFIVRKALAIDPNKPTVVNAMFPSPWGTFTVFATIPIAIIIVLMFAVFIGAFRCCSELLQVKTPVVDKHGKKVLAIVTE